MVLLLQLNGELPDRFPGHERRLYVFSCRKKGCRRKEGSIRAIRGIGVTTEAPSIGPNLQEKKTAGESSKRAKSPAPAPTTGLGESLFGVKPLAGSTASPVVNPFANPSSNINPFSKPSSPSPASQQAPAPTNTFGKSPKPSEERTTESSLSSLPKTFAATLTLNSRSSPSTAGPAPPPEPWLEESSLPPAFPVSWLSDAEYEVLEPTALPKVPQATTMDIDESADSAGAAGGKEDKVVFESSMDATFQRFADRVGQNPDQCIRYEYGGVPLLYAKGDEVAKLLGDNVEGLAKVKAAKGIPRCGNCGAGRVFEVQLMPHTIEELECEEDGLDGMDWGTVIVGVCERDCVERGQKTGETGYLEEWAGVQWEELTMKR